MEKKEEKKTYEDVKAMTERLEAANKETAELLERQERIQAQATVAGETEAGVPDVEKTDEEKSVDSARELLKGTGYDDILFPVEK